MSSNSEKHFRDNCMKQAHTIFTILNCINSRTSLLKSVAIHATHKKHTQQWKTFATSIQSFPIDIKNHCSRMSMCAQQTTNVSQRVKTTYPTKEKQIIDLTPSTTEASLLWGLPHHHVLVFHALSIKRGGSMSRENHWVIDVGDFMLANQDFGSLESSQSHIGDLGHVARACRPSEFDSMENLCFELRHVVIHGVVQSTISKTSRRNRSEKKKASGGEEKVIPCEARTKKKR